MSRSDCSLWRCRLIVQWYVRHSDYQEFRRQTIRVEEGVIKPSCYVIRIDQYGRALKSAAFFLCPDVRRINIL